MSTTGEQPTFEQIIHDESTAPEAARTAPAATQEMLRSGEKKPTPRLEALPTFTKRLLDGFG